MTRHVIVGFGVAGISAAEAIRSLDSQASITFIGEDQHGFYSRPGLAYYLTGEVPESLLYNYPPPAYKKLNAKFLRGLAKRVLVTEHTVEIEGGQNLVPYDRLLIAVGAQALQLNVPGVELEGVVKLDHMDDAIQILKLAKKAKKAVVVGGGITALELVEGLAAQRVKVHYLLRGDRYWGNVLDQAESAIVENRLKEEHITIQYHSEVVEILGKKGKVSGVRLASNETIPCDLVAVAVGVSPRNGLAVASGIAVERGILTNEFLQTNAKDVYAAGDVAQTLDLETGKHVLDSLWNSAREKGWVAGLNMAGRQISYKKARPLNITRLAGLTTTIIGPVGNGRDSDIQGIARGDSETWRDVPDAIIAKAEVDINCLRIMVGEKHIVGAVLMGDQTLSMPLQHMVENKVDITKIREQLLAPGAPLVDILINYWAELKKNDTKHQAFSQTGN